MSAPGVAEAFDRRRVVADLDADFLEDRVGVVLEDLESLLRHQLERLHRACQECLGRAVTGGAHRLAPFTPTSPPGPVLITHGVCLLSAPAAATPTGIGSIGSFAALGQGHELTEMGGRRRCMRECHRRHEQLLEPGLGGGLDLHDVDDGAFHLGPQLAREQRLHGARAGGVADRANPVERAVGHEPEHECVQRIDVGAEGTGKADVGERRIAGVLHEQVDAGPQGGLGELDRAHVVLGDRDPRRGIVRIAPEHVCERATVGDDARRARRQLALHHSVGVDHSGEVHLGDDIDDARPADAGDAGAGDLGGERGIVRPDLDPDHLEPRLEAGRIDAHAFDRARRGPLTGADLRPLERRSRRARCRVLTIAIAEHDLGVGADVDQQLHVLGPMRSLGQDRAGGVGPDVAGDARSDVDAPRSAAPDRANVPMSRRRGWSPA